MRICVFGAGAIGGLLAARLAAGGAQVSVVARGAQLAAIRADGLTIHQAGHTTTAQVAASDTPADLGPQDAVIVAVKAPALPSVAASIAPLLGPATAVVFAMNGIPWWYFQGLDGPMRDRQLPLLDPDARMAAAVAPDRVLGGVVYSYSEVESPGVIRLGDAPGRLVIGRPDGAPSPAAEAIAAALHAGGFACEVTPRIRDRVWSKLLGNLGSGPFAVLAAGPTGALMADPAYAELVATVLREAAAVARALGCDPGDPAAPLTMLRRSAHRQSILQDLDLGRPMEIDALCTIPVALAAELGVPVPTLSLLTTLIAARARTAGLYD